MIFYFKLKICKIFTWRNGKWLFWSKEPTSKSVVKVKSLSCATLCNPMDCTLTGSSIHGVFQARILESAAIFFSRRSSEPRDWTQVSHVVGRRFTIWATRKSMVTGYKNGTLWSLSQDWREVLDHLYRICIDASQKSVSWKKKTYIFSSNTFYYPHRQSIKEIESISWRALPTPHSLHNGGGMGKYLFPASGQMRTSKKIYLLCLLILLFWFFDMLASCWH